MPRPHCPKTPPPASMLTLLLWASATIPASPSPPPSPPPWSPEAVTRQGRLRGVRAPPPGEGLGPVDLFLGVPYAAPPTGELRFQPPEQPATWSGVRDAVRFAPACPQRPGERAWPGEQSEDCLYLNIYTPAGAVPGGAPSGHVGDRKPVMLYIHGGAYTTGSGNMADGRVLASFGDVVVVTVNYRLGALGFLSTGDEAARGNFGLLDQIQALRWVGENAAAFGGDARRVTVFGSGAGASCVSLLTLSRHAEGLFHRAIIQSGSALSSWALSYDPARSAWTLGERLGCVQGIATPPETPPTSAPPHWDSSALVHCLRASPASALTRVHVAPPLPYRAAFAPSVDGDVVPGDPQALMGQGEFLNYDVMLGVGGAMGVVPSDGHAHPGDSDDDGGHDGLAEDEFARAVDNFVDALYGVGGADEGAGPALREAVRFVYTDWAGPRGGAGARRRALAAMFSDHQWVAPAVATADLHARYGSATYFYAFGPARCRGAHGGVGGDGEDDAGGGDEDPYVFGAPLVHGHTLPGGPALPALPGCNFSLEDAALSTAVMTYWANFAKTGDPNRPSPPDAPAWARYDPRGQLYLQLGPRPRVRGHYRAAKVAFWLELAPRLHGLGAGPAPGSTSSTPRPRRLDSGAWWASPSSSKMATSAGTRSSLSAKMAAAVTARPPAGSEAGPAVMMAARRRDPGAGLSVTLAVGASLLLLNVLAFAALGYKRDRRRRRGRGTHRRPGVGLAPPKMAASASPSTSNMADGAGPTGLLDYARTLRRSPDDLGLPAPPPVGVVTPIPGALGFDGFGAFGVGGVVGGVAVGGQGVAALPHGHSTSRV